MSKLSSPHKEAGLQLDCSAWDSLHLGWFQKLLSPLHTHTLLWYLWLQQQQHFHPPFCIATLSPFSSAGRFLACSAHFSAHSSCYILFAFSLDFSFASNSVWFLLPGISIVSSSLSGRKSRTVHPTNSLFGDRVLCSGGVF